MTAPVNEYIKIDKTENRPVYELGKEATKKHSKDEEVDPAEMMEHNAQVVSKKIDEVIARNSWRLKPYYIFLAVVWEGRTGVLQQVVGERETRPDPEPGWTLWEFTPGSNVLKLEWTLPLKRHWGPILESDDEYPASIKRFIQSYQAGILK